jgi:hypothetical protein
MTGQWSNPEMWTGQADREFNGYIGLTRVPGTGAPLREEPALSQDVGGYMDAYEGADVVLLAEAYTPPVARQWR